jgi:hypothetical protein
MARHADEAQFAADKRQSLSHAGMAKARPSLLTGGIESNAVVAHQELESAVDKAEADVYRAGARMTGDIPQRLLRDAVQTERYRLRRLIKIFLGSEIDWNRLH